MQKRNPILVAILPFVTFGIYYLYWLIKNRKEMVDMGAKIPTTWIFATTIVPLIAFALLSFLLHVSSFLAVTTTLVLGVIVMLLFIYYFYKWSMAAAEVTKSGNTFGWILLVLFFVFSPVAMALAQDKFNKVG